MEKTDISYMGELEDANARLEERVIKLEKENRILKITYAKCRDCRHADLYNPNFAYPYIDPQCKLGIKTIHSDSDACCGHGDDEQAYIALKDGRRFVLDKMNW